MKNFQPVFLTLMVNPIPALAPKELVPVAAPTVLTYPSLQV